MNLIEDLRNWRAERPDEWTMDRFIREAQKQQNQLKNAYEQVIDLFYEEMCPTDKRSFMSEAESWLEDNK